MWQGEPALGHVLMWAGRALPRLGPWTLQVRAGVPVRTAPSPFHLIAIFQHCKKTHIRGSDCFAIYFSALSDAGDCGGAGSMVKVQCSEVLSFQMVLRI